MTKHLKIVFLFLATLTGANLFASPIDGRVTTRSIRNDPTYKGLPLCATVETIQFLCATRSFKGGEITVSQPNRQRQCYRAVYGEGGHFALYTDESGLYAISRGECLVF